MKAVRVNATRTDLMKMVRKGLRKKKLAFPPTMGLCIFSRERLPTCWPSTTKRPRSWLHNPLRETSSRAQAQACAFLRHFSMNPTATEDEMNNIYDYLRANGTLLGDRILETFPPLQGANDPLSPRLNDLVRPPLPAQAVAIQALAKFLKNGDAAKIVSECGTGKTLMSLATTYVHSNGRPYSTLIMCPPHLTLKWVRETFLTVPNCRVFLIEDMRNLRGHEPKKPHGVVECKLKDGLAVRKGEVFSLSTLRKMGRKQWLKSNPFPMFFVMSKERGKLGYFWRHATVIGQTGSRHGAVLNPETYERVPTSDGGFYSSIDFFDDKKKKIDEVVERPNGGTSIFAPLWSADRNKILRMAPAEYIGRYMKDWFDSSIADEMHQLAGNTAPGFAA